MLRYPDDNKTAACGWYRALFPSVWISEKIGPAASEQVCFIWQCDFFFITLAILSDIYLNPTEIIERTAKGNRAISWNLRQRKPIQRILTSERKKPWSESPLLFVSSAREANG